jgi:hypothetical protein
VAGWLTQQGLSGAGCVPLLVPPHGKQGNAATCRVAPHVAEVEAPSSRPRGFPPWPTAPRRQPPGLAVHLLSAAKKRTVGGQLSLASRVWRTKTANPHAGSVAGMGGGAAVAQRRLALPAPTGCWSVAETGLTRALARLPAGGSALATASACCAATLAARRCRVDREPPSSGPRGYADWCSPTRQLGKRSRRSGSRPARQQVMAATAPPGRLAATSTVLPRRRNVRSQLNAELVNAGVDGASIATRRTGCGSARGSSAVQRIDPYRRWHGTTPRLARPGLPVRSTDRDELATRLEQLLRHPPAAAIAAGRVRLVTTAARFRPSGAVCPGVIGLVPAGRGGRHGRSGVAPGEGLMVAATSTSGRAYRPRRAVRGSRRNRRH